jgi:hypothetical protein
MPSSDGDGTYCACNSCERPLSEHNHTYTGSNDKYGRMHYTGGFMVAEQDEIEVPREIDRKGWLHVARRERQTSSRMSFMQSFPGWETDERWWREARKPTTLGY